MRKKPIVSFSCKRVGLRSPKGSVENLAQMRGKEFVDDLPRRGEEYLDLAGTMPVDEAVLADAQPV